MIAVLKCGTEIQIDEQDAPILAQYNFAIRTMGKNVKRSYVVAPKNVYLHRLIMGFPKGKDVDHINHDCLDNRRSNLRVCTRSENLANARARPNKHGYRGIFKHSRRKAWRARIGYRDGLQMSKYFSTPEGAARAYDEMARARFGEFATLNFPEQSQ